MIFMFEGKERKVFKYHNGISDVWADPLALNRKIRALMNGDPAKVVANYNSDNQNESDAAAELFFPAIARAFEVAPFDKATGEGFVDEDLLKLWEMFQSWLDEKKKKEESSRTSVPPTAPQWPRFPGQS
ncbi:hypothetical protein AYO40_01220 [Planctomycetaceae bacterium SCGC AG-212-D15]|nr:hypothetical protein AYO40_01220 [Planctomycetaceae bacterium SCGC AG-212-D15]